MTPDPRQPAHPSTDRLGVVLVAAAHRGDVTAVASAVTGPRCDRLAPPRCRDGRSAERDDRRVGSPWPVTDARHAPHGDPDDHEAKEARVGRHARHDALELAERVVQHVADLAWSGRRRDVVVEVPPSVDCRALGLVLGRLLEDDHGAEGVADLLRHVVSVVRAGDLADVVLGRREDDLVGAEQVVDLVEYATVVVLTGLADLPRDERELVTALVARLAPTARVLDAADRVDSRSLAGRGDVVGLSHATGWMRDLSGDGDLSGGGALSGGAVLPGDGASRGRAPVPPRGTRAGIDGFVFRDPRPFHPGRLAHVLDVELVPERVGRLLRSKGFVQFATRPDRVGAWSSVGSMLSLDPTVLATFDEDAPLGQEIVFYGLGLQMDRLRGSLAKCLLRGDELLAGPRAWASYPDPFPRWPRATV